MSRGSQSGIRKLKAGEEVPRTGLFRLDKGMRVIPIEKVKREEKIGRIKKVKHVSRMKKIRPLKRLGRKRGRM